jgi:hypothetical protein
VRGNRSAGMKKKLLIPSGPVKTHLGQTRGDAIHSYVLGSVGGGSTKGQTYHRHDDIHTVS